MHGDNERMTITLTTGKTLDAYDDVVGLRINPHHPSRHELCTGYDAEHLTPPPNPTHKQMDAVLGVDYEFTHAECVEIADIMLGKWKAFRDRHYAQTPEGQQAEREAQQAVVVFTHINTGRLMMLSDDSGKPLSTVRVFEIEHTYPDGSFALVSTAPGTEPMRAHINRLRPL